MMIYCFPKFGNRQLYIFHLYIRSHSEVLGMHYVRNYMREISKPLHSTEIFTEVFLVYNEYKVSFSICFFVSSFRFF